MCLLRVENLSVESWPGKNQKPQSLLRNVHVGIGKNKITALIGESGAGKSIFSRVISALLPEHVYITTGRFFFKGQEVDNNRLKKGRGREIFYSPQNAAAALNPVLKIRNQIREVSKISIRSLLEILKMLRIDEPEKLLNSYPCELSEGENQRALLTMAIALKPLILILDEPASALDTDAQHDFMKLLKSVQLEYSLSVLLITHNLSIVRSIADYIYIILAGEIIEEGKAERIFKRPAHPYTKEITGYF